MNDKLLHFMYGAGIYLFLAPFTKYAILAVIFIGAGKEIADRFYGGTVEVFDFMATALGGFIGVVVFTLYQLL